jgi:hypothetical protein
MAVNAYLVWDPASRAAVVFDTGADSSEMVRFATKENLDAQLILLTRTPTTLQTSRACGKKLAPQFLPGTRARSRCRTD